MTTEADKITKLKQQVAQLIKQNQRVQFLERENSRRRGETSQIAAAVNRRG